MCIKNFAATLICTYSETIDFSSCYPFGFVKLYLQLLRKDCVAYFSMIKTNKIKYSIRKATVTYRLTQVNLIIQHILDYWKFNQHSKQIYTLRKLNWIELKAKVKDAIYNFIYTRFFFCVCALFIINFPSANWKSHLFFRVHKTNWRLPFLVN